MASELSNLQIIFQNPHFIVIDKPADWLSVPSRMGKADPRPVAGLALQTSLGQAVFPVHRLDEPVSGLLIFALSPSAQRASNAWFERHTISKTYSALTSCPAPAGGEDWITWTCQLAKGKKRAYIAPHGKNSITLAKHQGIVAPDLHKWHLRPVTGRSHQLRFEMARHDMPINGDTLYGSKYPARASRGIDLRCFLLDFSACANRQEFQIPEFITVREI